MPKRFKVGDQVVVAASYVNPSTIGRVYTVKRVNPKNYICTANDGGRGLNYPDEALEPYNPAVPLARAQATFVEYREPLALGQIVTLTGGYPKLGWTPDTPLVVLVDKIDKVNVAELGGGAGQSYVRARPASIVKRDATWLRERLAS